MSNKKKSKVESIKPPVKAEWTNIFKTTYYRWRYWVKEILASGGIKKYRFVKDEVGYNGNIAVDKQEADAAKKVLQNYKSKNTETKDMWW